MKKILLCLTLFLSLLFLCTVTVNAKEITANDIEPNSYVIGSHIYTGNITVTTNHIMLAAKTIDSNALSDMIIYYKTPRGGWINGATGASLTVPTKFNIEYIDLALVEEQDENYTITYNLDGGTANNPTEYTDKTLPITLNNPTKEGYMFLGWTGSNGDLPEKEVTIEKGITGALEYIANWAMYGDVDSDGVIGIFDEIALSKHLTDTEKLNEFQLMVMDLNIDGEVDYVDLHILSKYIVGDIEQLPYDSGEKYTISYDLDGGSVNNPSVYAQISLPMKLNNPTKEGYIFLGWTGNNGNIPELEVIINEGLAGDFEYTANWGLCGDVNEDGVIDTKDAVAITQYINWGSSLTEQQLLLADLNQDGEVDDVDAQIMTQYLGGWEITLPYDSGEKYTITYNLDGGILEDRNFTSYAEMMLPFTLNKPTKEWYVFLGWTGSNGDTPELTVKITPGTTRDLEYTANWGLCGDVNEDGVIDTKDAVAIAQYIAGDENLNEKQLLVADLNQDGEVDDVDAQIMAQYLGGWDITLPYKGELE